jgi:hypothetical protein
MKTLVLLLLLSAIVAVAHYFGPSQPAEPAAAE